MPSTISAVVALLTLVSDSQGVRRTQKVSADAETTSSSFVSGVYTFGAPGQSTTAFRNGRRSDGIFDGVRQWNFDGNRVDPVPMITVPIGYNHPTINALAQGPSTDENFNHTQTMSPRFGIPSVALHELSECLTRFTRVYRSGLIHDIAQVGAKNSYVWNFNQMWNNLAGTGWELRSLAWHSGGVYGVGGRQVSHLLRNGGGDCILTFQGTNEDEDWQANMDFGRDNFCGLPGQVHRGFRDHLRRMVHSNDFQSFTKPEMARCTRVYVTGHSLGGAMASMFSACANRASRPSSREDPENDYGFISWS